MISFNAFFSESVSEASFNRMNLLGVMMGNPICIPTFPYHLTSNLILHLYENEKNLIGRVDFDIQEDGRIAKSFSQEAAGSEAFLIVPVSAIIPGPGGLEVTIRAMECSWKKRWEFELGRGQLRAASGGVPSQAVIDGRCKYEPVTGLIKEVREELFIADQFVSPGFIEKILPRAANSWQIRVIIGRSKTNRSEWRKNIGRLKRAFPGLQVRVDNLLHDRFIMRDREELYAFGHSIDSLNKDRVSFFHRIFDLDSMNKIAKMMNESWNRASHNL